MREVFAEPHTLINESGSYSGRIFFEFSNTFILKTFLRCIVAILK